MNNVWGNVWDTNEKIPLNILCSSEEMIASVVCSLPPSHLKKNVYHCLLSCEYIFLLLIPKLTFACQRKQTYINILLCMHISLQNQNSLKKQMWIIMEVSSTRGRTILFIIWKTLGIRPYVVYSRISVFLTTFRSLS